MAVTLNVPRDRRYGELGAGMGALFGRLLQNRQQQQIMQAQQEALVNMGSATNKQEYLRAAGPLIDSPARALEIQKRADEKFAATTKLQEYKITLRAPDGTIREDVRWMDEPNLDTLRLKDSVDTKLGSAGMQFMFGTPGVAPAAVEPKTGAFTTTGPVPAKDFASREQGRAARERAKTERVERGTKVPAADVEAQDILRQYGMVANQKNMGNARQVSKARGRVNKTLTNIYAEKFGTDWASFGENSQKFLQANELVEKLIIMGTPEAQALAIGVATVKRDLGEEPTAEENQAATQATEQMQQQAPRDLEADIGGVFSTIKGFFTGGEPEQPAQPAQPSQPQESLVPLGTKDGEVIYIPNTITRATDAVDYLVGQGWSYEDARAFVLAQEGK